MRVVKETVLKVQVWNEPTLIYQMNSRRVKFFIPSYKYVKPLHCTDLTRCLTSIYIPIYTRLLPEKRVIGFVFPENKPGWRNGLIYLMTTTRVVRWWRERGITSVSDNFSPTRWRIERPVLFRRESVSGWREGTSTETGTTSRLHAEKEKIWGVEGPIVNRSRWDLVSGVLTSRGRGIKTSFMRVT